MITVEWHGDLSVSTGTAIKEWLVKNIGPGRYNGPFTLDKIHKDDVWGHCDSPTTLDSDWLFFFRDEEAATLFKLTWL